MVENDFPRLNNFFHMFFVFTIYQMWVKKIFLPAPPLIVKKIPTSYDIVGMVIILVF